MITSLAFTSINWLISVISQQQFHKLEVFHCQFHLLDQHFSNFYMFTNLLEILLKYIQGLSGSGMMSLLLARGQHGGDNYYFYSG